MSDNVTLAYQELLLAIKNSKLLYELTKAKEIIYKNPSLMADIKLYHLTKDENLRLNIYNNKEYKNYKKLENEFNLLILKINQILKTINN